MHEHDPTPEPEDDPEARWFAERRMRYFLVATDTVEAGNGPERLAMAWSVLDAALTTLQDDFEQLWLVRLARKALPDQVEQPDPMVRFCRRCNAERSMEKGYDEERQMDTLACGFCGHVIALWRDEDDR